MCPALQKKPTQPAPDFSKDAQGAGTSEPKKEDKKPHDPFAPPYVPNLLLGEVRDELEGYEYVLLVSAAAVAMLEGLDGD